MHLDPWWSYSISTQPCFLMLSSARVSLRLPWSRLTWEHFPLFPCSLSQVRLWKGNKPLVLFSFEMILRYLFLYIYIFIICDR